jgi:hypothetical protein
MLALEQNRDFGSETAEHLVGRIDDMPVGLEFAGLGHVSRHFKILWFL